MKENLIVTSIKIDKRLPNKVQLANIYFEQKNGIKRTSYQFISEAIIEKLKKEGIK
jgi:hypothetical protein